MHKLFMLTGLLLSGIAHADADWSRGVSIPTNGRDNPYHLSQRELSQAVRQGREHALNYPIQITGLKLPYAPINSILNADSKNPFRKLVQSTVGNVSGWHNFDQAQAWLGMHTYPNVEGSGAYFIPFPPSGRPDTRMGFTLIDTPLGKTFTISCAECHSANLFGRKILGLSNRFPRANAFFALGLSVLPFVSNPLFQAASGATTDEVHLFQNARIAAQYIGAKTPSQLGLDTSLAQVALSLAKRKADGWATRIRYQPPRFDPIVFQSAESKPAVWWNLKYKNRWLSDGSVVSGNPIYTNFIWNEIGRGTDLHTLDAWFTENKQKIEDLTTAVFASEAPQWDEFFPDHPVNEGVARQGQQIFKDHCSRCHGVYQKGWDLKEAITWTIPERARTYRVNYPSQTHVVDVGTDSGRYRAMKSLVQLNQLVISKRQGIVIEPQKGYVPPPLVGIWARWPYFHNNSAPTLCAVLTRGQDRPQQYWAREAENRETDFDRRCNGYPAAPVKGASAEYQYDTRRQGLSNLGHDEGIFLQNGEELFTTDQKMALVAFLQTL